MTIIQNATNFKDLIENETKREREQTPTYSIHLFASDLSDGDHVTLNFEQHDGESITAFQKRIARVIGIINELYDNSLGYRRSLFDSIYAVKTTDFKIRCNFDGFENTNNLWK
ncbi:hypothetical protein WJ01_28145 [Burkholderia vietnamiensis]|nr:hypothetical protein WJ01_28145 [Burkholderia vietnamiensis]